MAIRVTRRAAEDEERMRGLFQSLDCPHPNRWEGGPGQVYDWHAHPYDKILFVIAGAIVFSDRELMNYQLEPGDRMDLPAGTEHRAVAGDAGITCIESFR
jgi:mannose-6-phosphate isomerase-like protein (cupin superfamily)